jgi:hypothetical protein
MIKTSKNTLLFISLLFWIIGGIILLFKGIILLLNAHLISPSLSTLSIVLMVAFIIGLLKSRLFMLGFLRKNVNRINRIDEPKIHQFFSPGFIFALFLMIITGLLLSRLALGSYNLLLFVGGLDFSLSIALFTSSIIFINRKFGICVS